MAWRSSAVVARTVVAVVIAAMMVLRPPVASGGPTIVRDELLQDTAITPSLGRGYSIATNTFQSMCLIDVVGTTPSYDFDYSFQEYNQDQIRTGAVTSTTDTTGGARRANWWDEWNRSDSSSEWKTKRVTTDRGGETHYHFMMVMITINVYYNSVDETKSKMSPAATKILEGRDLPGFFDACGMYYVRSISRRARVFSMFVYSSQSSTRDVSFDSYIKNSIRNFDLPNDKDYTNSQSNSQTTVRGTMSTKQSSSSLQITTTAVGLGKQEATDLIAYDLATYKASVKSAFRATLPQNVGRVTAIEVVPWMENTEFQALYRLEPLTVPVLDAMGFPVMDTTNPDRPVPKTKQMVPYEQKRILQVNAEFLAEVDRAARAKMNAFYKAKMCRATINIDHMEMDENGKYQFRARDPKQVPPKPEDNVGKITWAWNNRKPGVAILLEDLDKILSEEALQRIWMEYDAFMYGGTGEDDPEAEKDPKKRAELARAAILGNRASDGYPRNIFPGAGKCISDLFVLGITAYSYRSVKSCKRVEESFGTVTSQAIDDFCMPRYTTAPVQAGSGL